METKLGRNLLQILTLIGPHAGLYLKDRLNANFLSRGGGTRIKILAPRHHLAASTQKQIREPRFVPVKIRTSKVSTTLSCYPRSTTNFTRVWEPTLSWNQLPLACSAMHWHLSTAHLRRGSPERSRQSALEK